MASIDRSEAARRAIETRTRERLAAWPVAARVEPIVLPTGILMLLAGSAQFARQWRWAPFRTFAEPLVTILHLAFLFVPVGFLLLGVALLLDDAGLQTAGIHAWTVGAIGGMTLAVMTRATRGHSGQALHAPLSTVLAIYAPVMAAAFARVASALMPEQTMLLLPLAGVCWSVAFLGFALLYGPMLLGRRSSP